MARVLTNTDPVLRRCWHPVARAEEVTEQPHGVMLLGEPWVLYRSGGEVRAFADRCPHRHCPLTLGHCEGGVLQCAYHGWRFDGDGRCVEIPALGEGATLPPAARLTPAGDVTEAHGIVFIAPEPLIAPLGTIEEADDPTFMVGLLPTLRARGSAGLLADNFLDIAHFPFVHAGTFGTEEAAEVAPFAVARDDWSFTVSYEHPFAHREDPGVAAGVRPLIQTRRLTYRLRRAVPPPAAHRLRRLGGLQRHRFLHPARNPETCRLFTTLWRDDLDGDEGRMAEAVAFEVAVLREDLRIQEAYHELVLPLDSTARSTPGPTAPPWSCGGSWPTWWRPFGGLPGDGGHRRRPPSPGASVGAARDRDTGSDTFRQLTSEVSGLLAYEALRDLGTDQVTVDTPVVDAAPSAPRGRGGAPGADPARRARHGAGDPGDRAADRGGARRPAARRLDTAFRGLPEPPATRPQWSPGHRLRSHARHRRLAGPGLRAGTGPGAAGIIALCIVASEPGLATFGADHPGVRVYCAAMDPDLNGTGFIVPGLGDAGDRLFGPPD